MPVYAWICLNKQGSEYVSAENMPEKIHSYLALFETEMCSEPCQTAKMERCGRIFISFD